MRKDIDIMRAKLEENKLSGSTFIGPVLQYVLQNDKKTKYLPIIAEVSHSDHAKSFPTVLAREVPFESKVITYHHFPFVQGMLDRASLSDVLRNPSILAVYLDRRLMNMVFAMEHDKERMRTLKITRVKKVTLAQTLTAMGIPKLHEAGYMGQGVRIAVLDTGANPDHPMIKPNLVHMESVNPDEPDPIAHNPHGPWCLSASGGAFVNDEEYGPMFGAAPKAQLISIKVLDKSGGGAISTIIKGMDRALELGADVISMSLGATMSFGDTTPDDRAVDILNSLYATPAVIAAGNNGAPHSIASPGDARNSLTIGSVGFTEPWRYSPSMFSSKGPTADNRVKPDFTAFGGDIYGNILELIMGASDVSDEYEGEAGTCLVGDTKLLTNPGGVKEIKDIKPGDKVYTFDNGQLVSRKVNAILSNGVKPVFKVVLKDREIIATDNHPILTVVHEGRGQRKLVWKTVSQLKEGDMVVVLRKQPSGKTDKPKEFFRFLGFMIGDGWVTKNKRTHMVCFAESAHEDINEYYLDLAEKLFGKKPKRYRHNNNRHGWYYFFSKEAGELLIDWGLDKHAKEKGIDSRVFAAPIEHRIEFIRGLMDADAHLRKKYLDKTGNERYEIEIASRKLAEDLKLLAQTVGIHVSNIRERTRKIKAPNSKEPVMSTTYNLIITFSEIGLGADLGMGVTRDFEGGKYLRSLFDWSVFMLRKVKAIVPWGEAEVFDIEVDKSHNFIANNIVVHNSMATPQIAGLVALIRQIYHDDTITGVKQVLEDILRPISHRPLSLPFKDVFEGWGTPLVGSLAQ